MTIIRHIAVLTLALSSTTGFANKTATIAIADTILGNRVIEYELINDYAVVEGDIIIGKLIDMTTPTAIIKPRLGSNLWHEGPIPFDISPDLPMPNKLAIRQAISHWQAATHLEFIEITAKNRNEYHDYLAFVPAQGTTCSSYVGRLGGRQEINLSPRCNTMITAHEIGHALGLWHEQSRADRDNYIKILWENIAEDHRYNFEQHFSDGRDFGEYDYQSIMHYGPYAFSKNGQPTIVPLIAGANIGQRGQLSDKDIAAINALYPEP